MKSTSDLPRLAATRRGAQGRPPDPHRAPLRVAAKHAHRLSRDFYDQNAEPLARALIGKIIVRRAGQQLRRARIVETEAYVGPHDLASHSSKGRTARTEVMFGRAGHAYIYFIYGMYNMFNIVAGGQSGQAVLIRAADPMDGWEADLTGPGKLCRAMNITREDNRADLVTGGFFLEDDGAAPRISRSRRIGVDYARKWKHALLRFYDRDSRAVSKHPSSRRGKTPMRKILPSRGREAR